MPIPHPSFFSGILQIYLNGYGNVFEILNICASKKSVRERLFFEAQISNALHRHAGLRDKSHFFLAAMRAGTMREGLGRVCRM